VRTGGTKSHSRETARADVLTGLVAAGSFGTCRRTRKF
jgi:hypothetical protein